MNEWVVVVTAAAALAAAAAIVYLLRRSQPPLAVGAAAAPPPPPKVAVWLLADAEAFRDVSPAHVDAAHRAAHAFAEALARTFQPQASDKPAEAVRALFAQRALVLTALHELRMRLPNDLARERQLAAVTEAADRQMLEHIEDARQRCGAPLLHPGPLGDAWYGRWYRASNDWVS